MKQPRSFKGAFDREVKEWGYILTMDHLVSIDKELTVGVTGDIDALVVKDIYSSLKHCYPSATKDADTTALNIRHFIGRRTIAMVYSDGSGELKAACEQLSIVHELSQPGIPKTNAIAERQNSDVLAMTRTSLVAAGLPACF